MRPHSILSYFLVVFGLVYFVLGYEHYSVDYLSKIISDPTNFSNVYDNVKAMFIELGNHLTKFGYNYYHVYIENINLDDYKSLAIAVRELFGEFRHYFLNLITISMLAVSSYIRAEGNFIQRARVPLQVTILITTIYVVLMIVSNLNI